MTSPLTVTKPIQITDARLVSSSVPADTTPLWVAATTYTTGQVVLRPNHHLYESVAGVKMPRRQKAPPAAKHQNGSIWVLKTDGPCSIRAWGRSRQR
ncbi:hypothetical protein [Neopusillimonas aromaticivorans]|uniref:hypothetical protein n=1 Tax=Neopusillimonas aromaticivorans TaxID=2979868 RepID=UPI002594DB90|nr:hypothetical protein [Neopusillimonas aromaticivorans]WJJ93988.1 hypothetical protein N7E01_02075 [Neopusillimonas aromaticivorans]